MPGYDKKKNLIKILALWNCEIWHPNIIMFVYSELPNYYRHFVCVSRVKSPNVENTNIKIFPKNNIKNFKINKFLWVITFMYL